MEDRKVFKDYDHQAEEWERRDLNARALIWQMRTGKTKPMIDLACYLSETNKIVSTVIIAPNGVHYNWMYREIPSHIWDILGFQHEFLHWSSSKTKDPEIKAAISSKEHLWFTLNSEALFVPRAFEALLRILKRGPALLIVDECHDFRTPGSKRTKRLRGLAPKFAYRRILTGTTVDNSPLAAFSQFELLQPGALGHTKFSNFKHVYAEVAMRRMGNRMIPKVTGYKNLDILHRNISRWSSFVGREGLPPFISITRDFEMTPRQKKLYTQLKKELKAELDSGVLVEAVEGGARMIKLQQVISGFIIDEYQEVHPIPGPNPRLDALVSELSGSSTIVWAKFRQDIRLIADRLRKEGISFVEYHGDIPQNTRQEAIDTFMSGDAQVFLGQPAAGGTGLNLSIADTVIWYSLTFNAIEYNQASERATKVDGDKIALVHFNAIDSIDSYILKMLKEKKSIARDVIEGGEIREYL